MLLELTIEKFAVIDRLRVQLAPGFTVVTGETGAGKSIIIDALQAALGGKVAGDVVRSGAQQAVAEAVFEWPSRHEHGPTDLLQEHGIERDDNLILRREINASGRSVSRVNARTVPVAVLNALGSWLVDIHGQTDHLSIFRRDRQLEALDRFANLLPLRAEVGEWVRQYDAVRIALKELEAGRHAALQRLDLLRFQVDEIESAALESDEEDELAADRNLLLSAERRSQFATAIYEAVQGDNRSALEILHPATFAAAELASLDPDMEEVQQRLASVEVELDDVAQGVRRYRDQVEFDPARQQLIEERLDQLLRLKRKYGSTVDEVIAFGARAREELLDVENVDDRVVALEQERERVQRAVAEGAGRLSSARQQAAAELNASVQNALQGLNLRGAMFDARVTQVPDAEGLRIPGLDDALAYSRTGVDHISFLVSFNPGEPARQIDKVASGGETSRFLLALKGVLADADSTPTLVFDEVDTGVGGRSGLAVGERLRALSAAHQVISITHLPQVAALADQHLLITKVAQDDRTTVGLHVIDAAERVNEIAAMMSGTDSAAARRTAEELLSVAAGSTSAQASTT